MNNEETAFTHLHSGWPVSASSFQSGLILQKKKETVIFTLGYQRHMTALFRGAVLVSKLL